MSPQGNQKDREKKVDNSSEGVDIPGTFPAIKTADEFRRAAVHLFGAHGWLRETSRAMGVDESTVWRWVNEQSPIKNYALAAMSAWIHIFKLSGERPPRAENKRR